MFRKFTYALDMHRSVLAVTINALHHHDFLPHAVELYTYEPKFDMLLLI